MGKLAFIFPGQGSQSVGMGRDLHDRFEEARGVFEAVDGALNEPLSRTCFEGPEEAQRLTATTQPSILTVSAAATSVLERRGVRPDYVAGHSLGEYSALLAAGACDVGQAARAVRARGTFMQDAVPAGRGAMIAVLGLAPEKVAETCARVAAETGEVVSPANYNDPLQTVVAGTTGAVERCSIALKEAGARRVVPLPVSAPFHCALMEPVKAPLEAVLRKVGFRAPTVPVVTNVEASPNSDPGRIVPLLLEQVTAAVRWVECVNELVRLGVTRVVEVGPGRVLCGLVRRIAKDVETLNVEDGPSLDNTLRLLERKA